MNEFRRTFERLLEGRESLATVESELQDCLAREPHLAAAHGALIEAMYRSDRISGEAYLVLIRAIHAFQQVQTQTRAQAAQAAESEDRTILRASPAPVSPVAGSAADMAAGDVPPDRGADGLRRDAPADAPEDSADRTILRASPDRPGAGDAGPERPPFAGQPPAEGEDKTLFRSPPVAPATADADKTQFRPLPVAPPDDDGDKTRLRPAPVVATIPTLTTPTTTGSTTTGTTGSSWSEPARWAHASGDALSSGSVIKERFVLEDQIGRGGMGTVFKARDLRKEEAQDRNPYVAIKILNEEFKRHPKSLQALQREARKAQKLAHPNIVTVYDFDRDGANVYMVMELLEGESLERVIKRTEGVGVGTKEALRITRDLCKAMAYAHEQGIVHADFKPANAFLTRDGVAKVFDFGIARAVKRGDQDAGTMTLFDPGTLGALTPAYASCEVIDGEEPDARDDVYAIGCVVYELLTGSHPFKRMSATQARAQNIELTAPPGLTRRQWRALQRSLEWKREQRQASARQFLEEFLPLRYSSASYVGAAAAAVAVVVLGIMLATNQFAKYRERSIARSLATANAATIEALLPKLRELEPARRAAVFLNEPARTGLIRYFDARIDEAVDATKGRYAYPQAETLLAALKGFFPDSQAVRDIEDRLIRRKSDEIKRQSDLLDAALARGALIPAQDTPNVIAVLERVREIDPRHQMLRDPRLPGAFAAQTRLALEQQNIPLAEAMVTAGLSFDQNDTTLTDLRDQVRLAARAQEFSARKTELEHSLRRLMNPPATLAEIDRQRAPLVELRSIDPRSEVLLGIQAIAQRAVNEQTKALVAKEEFSQAQELVARYADIVSPEFVSGKRRALAAAENPADDAQAGGADASAGTDMLPTPEAVAELTDETLNALMAAGLQRSRLSIPEARSLGAVADELARRGDPGAAKAKRDLKIHLAKDAAAINARRGVDAAIEFAQAAYTLFPESPLLKKTLINLRVTAAQRAAEQRDASIGDVKTKLDVLLGSKRIDEEWAGAVDRQLRRLAAFLPDTDPYVVQSKARAAARYTERATLLREAQRLTEAGTVLERARKYSPGAPEVQAEEKLLKQARERQARAAQERDRAAQLTSLKQKLFVQAQANEVVEARASLQELRESLPEDDPFLTRDGPNAIGQAYLRMASNAAKEGRFKNALTLADLGREIAPSLPNIAAIRQRYARYQAINDHLSRRSRIEARSVRSELTTLAAQDPAEVAAVSQRLARNLVARINSTSNPDLAERLSRAARDIFGEEALAGAVATTSASSSN